MILAIGIIALAIGLFAIQIFSLKWGLARAEIVNISLFRAFLYFLLFAFVAGFLGAIAEVALGAFARAPSEIESALLITVLQPIIAALLFALIYRARIAAATRATIPFCVALVAPMLLTVLVIRPFVYEAYFVPTNSMAPTLLGDHWTGTCPRCGHIAYGFLQEPHAFAPEGVPMICSHELKSCVIPNPSTAVGSGDQFMVSKLKTPRRWDLIVFKFPEDPSVCFVKRIVGLPGEEVIIRDGAILIDGKKIEPPEALQGIEYLSTIPHAPSVVWGTDDHPAKLGDDEYFVLGDFSAQAYDSRFWQRSSPEHSPYAVPADHIIGVVTHIYWPISRWREFDWDNR